MKKLWILPILMTTACFSLGWVGSQQVLRILHPGPIHVKAHTQWASDAGTVSQQAEKADIVVRGHVKRLLKSRVFENSLVGQTDRPDHRFPPKFSVLAFTEALFVVDKVYRGTAPPLINVIQTGGYVPENAHHPAAVVEVDDDPLFVKGGEHVLFLRAVTNDPKLAPGRTVYWIVNSAGRYDIHGDKVFSHSDLPGKRPNRFADLRQQISAAR
jgi:hypothetical protein